MKTAAIISMGIRLFQLGAKLKAEGRDEATDAEMAAATTRADEAMDNLDDEIARREALGE